MSEPPREHDELSVGWRPSYGMTESFPETPRLNFWETIRIQVGMALIRFGTWVAGWTLTDNRRK